MKFKMEHSCFDNTKPVFFNEKTAPRWLCEGGRAGSTMDNRWFWNDHVLALKVGESVQTDFQTITRVE